MGKFLDFPQQVTKIITSQTWVVPIGITQVTFEAWGGGGGGGGSDGVDGGSGGGGGAYSRKFNVNVMPGQRFTITIGSGGSGGAGGSGNDGTAGQDTTITQSSTKTIVLAKAGALGGGGGPINPGGAGGSASSCIGDIAFSGGTGASNPSEGGGGGGSGGNNGQGGDTTTSTGGSGGANNGSNGANGGNPGGTGILPGSGGGGGNVSGSATGGNGASGQVNIIYRYSFLHTIGRLIGSLGVVIAQKVGETERPTSQIIIDKVFQGQKAAVALSTVTLNMDVNIPSQDADLIVTGGSVIATGAAWSSVTLNGTPLTKLVQTGVTGQSAEIWWTPRPGVGTKTLKIVSGTGGEINVNAMIVLGLDNRDINIITASATDAATTSTISNTVTPDAANCLIVDCLTSLDATATPVPDQLQTQVFNANQLVGSEYVMSTYKIGQVGSQKMSWNLSASVNASLVTAVFRPAQAASIWFPNIDLRTIDDTVTTAGLDAEVNPAFGNYGYKAPTFWKNSFFQTVGRIKSGTPSFIWQQLIGSGQEIPRENLDKTEVINY